ncbi:fatty acid desaturase family protein [Brevibacillus laterosporus GI-9]|uniref:fatty acid desaturase family protein n=1 Tax=Brevibacillus laterosporus TaxID=1465 RepID=UPI0002404EBE|nr:fatty acid desaturase family protein [Brevibacillus laterosporus]CCF15394.1 fatty acid desaturase family protein [Brevibacillus laterosporus GI-9]
MKEAIVGQQWEQRDVTPQSATSNKGSLFSKDIMNQLKGLQKKNNWYNFFALGLDWSLIALVILLAHVYQNLWTYIGAIIVIGGRMRGLDNLMHEASHNMLFKSRWLNKWVGSIFIAFPVITNYKAYCDSHYRHHKYLWTDKDPDTSELKAMGLNHAVISKKYFIFRYIFGSIFIKHVFRNVLSAGIRLFSKQDQTIVEYIIKLCLWSSVIALSIIYHFWLELILYWFVPLVTVFPVIRFWSDLADHSGLETSDPLYSSRNSYGNCLERLILYPHHDTYHIVHHLFPYIPHYNLKKAHLVLMNNADYAKAHHCTGFFKTFLPGFRSVIDDIVTKLNHK